MNKMRTKTVIFDLDGTLLNTITDLSNAVNYALEKMKLEKVSVEECLQYVGSGISNLLLKSFKGVDADLDKARIYFNEYYDENCTSDSVPYLDVYNMLMNLKEHDAKIGVASNKDHNYVEKICNHYFEGLVDAYQGMEDSLEKKPSPDILNKVLSKLDSNKDDMVYVGDSEIDIETAKNLGCKAIFVSYGFRGYDNLVDAGAVNIAKNPSELLELLERI